MATKPQQGAAQAAADPGGGRVFKPVLLLVLLLPVAALMAPTAILLVASLAPTMVARLLDHTRGSYLTWTVMGMNVVGSLYFLHELWSLGDDFSSLMIVIGDPVGWLAAMAGAGFGWVIYFLMPLAATRIAASQSALRMRRVTRDLEQLTAEWGPGVADKEE